MERAFSKKENEDLLNMKLSDYDSASSIAKKMRTALIELSKHSRYKDCLIDTCLHRLRDPYITFNDINTILDELAQCKYI